MAGKQKLMTPLDYVALLAGAPPPQEEPEVQQVPVPTPVWMPRPVELDQSAMFGGPDPYGEMNPGQPYLPPPIATPPDGMAGIGGMFAPDGGAFG